MGSRSSAEDDLSTSFRRSHISGDYDHDRRFEARNTEDVHKDALAAALAEHERIRETAVRAYKIYEAREAQEKLRIYTLQQEEHLRIETERAKLECTLRDLDNKARQIPKPAPRIPTPPPVVETPKPKPPPPPPAAPAPPPVVETPKQSNPPPVAQVQKPPTNLFSQPQTSPFSQQQNNSQTLTTVSGPKNTQVLTQPTAQSVQPPRPIPTPVQQPQPPAPPVQSPRPVATNGTSHLLPGAENYAQIHQSLKKLRQWVMDAGNQNKEFKKKVGEMRRTLRMTVGQLTAGTGTNAVQRDKVTNILSEALTKVRSDGVDPGNFMLSKPEPKQGATHNEATLPSLFIFLLDHFSKAVISQLANEASINPDAADPIGILVAQVFSSPALHWRGASMIDIFMAKMWKECPVLFGARGSEKTEEGRARLGWRKESRNWVEELVHTNRMTGLAAGYAAISLRNFSRTKMENPYPPYHYWQSLAAIVATPPAQTSTTQFTVLKGLIMGFEGKFLEFYGNAGKAALRIALVDFPDRAPDQNNPAVGSLRVLADILERDTGLRLR